MSSVKDKLYNYEQTPPVKAWEKIAAALDESHITDEFPSKLYNAEATPPAGTWNRIAASLDPELAAPVIPINRNFSFFRYAVAALLIGLVAFGVVKWANRNSNNVDPDLAGISKNPVNKSSSKDENSTSIKKDPDLTEQPKDRTTDEPVNEVATTAETKSSPVKKARSRYSVATDPGALDATYAYNEHTPNLADRYIMLMTPEGGIIRMSKKWGDMVCCVSGQEQDKDCKDQIKKWQEKLACAPVANNNFMDILSLVNTLNTDL